MQPSRAEIVSNWIVSFLVVVVIAFATFKPRDDARIGMAIAMWPLFLMFLNFEDGYGERLQLNALLYLFVAALATSTIWLLVGLYCSPRVQFSATVCTLRAWVLIRRRNTF